MTRNLQTQSRALSRRSFLVTAGSLGIAVAFASQLADVALAGLTGRLHDDEHGGWVSSIAPDGTVSAKAANGRLTAVGKLKLVTPEQPLQRGTDGLFRAADGNDLPADTNARVQDGALEGSNVSPVETMVAMISAARQFEAQMKMLSTAEGNEKAAAQLLSAN